MSVRLLSIRKSDVSFIALKYDSYFPIVLFYCRNRNLLDALFFSGRRSKWQKKYAHNNTRFPVKSAFYRYVILDCAIWSRCATWRWFLFYRSYLGSIFKSMPHAFGKLVKKFHVHMTEFLFRISTNIQILVLINHVKLEYSFVLNPIYCWFMQKNMS